MLEAPRKTGKWLRDDVPHTGWRCDEIKESHTTCEMCEVTPIVYAHRMVHERYPLWLDCGCVCAGFMVEDPAAEQLREVLYKWRKLQLLNRTPVEKLRRRNWHFARWRRDDKIIFGWSYHDRDHRFSFEVKIDNKNGWRFEVYNGWQRILTSDPFTNDLDAALAGIAWAEMLMANQQWLASDSEARAEERVARRTEERAYPIRSTAGIARRLKFEDIAVAVETGQLPYEEAWTQIGRRKREDQQ